MSVISKLNNNILLNQPTTACCHLRHLSDLTRHTGHDHGKQEAKRRRPNETASAAAGARRRSPAASPSSLDGAAAVGVVVVEPQRRLVGDWTFG